VANLTALGPAASLTGAVRRGDVQTIRAHLQALGPEDRELYRAVGRAAVALASEAGLDAAAAARVNAALDEALIGGEATA
jgi:predicted short-subunit dehydrogenase-like oxidoreductase (DUF2520 family)